MSVGDITVFHDEIELPPAKLRVKIGGGIAGHNGLRSISAHVGNDYRRVRLGVGHPGVKDLVHHHVLSDFAKSEMPWVKALCEAVADNAAFIVTGQDASFANKVHLAMDAKDSHRRTMPAGSKPRIVRKYQGRLWVLNAASSDCLTSASPHCSTR
jgi:PTH1 family peptidyl-tRNA hydrolase